MKSLLNVLFYLAVAGCAASPAIGETPPQNPLDSLAKFTAADVQAALEDATKHKDQAAMNCYTTLLDVMKNMPALGVTTPKGAVSAFQDARDLMRSTSGVSDLAQKVNLGCAALFVDANYTLLKLGVMVGGSTVGLPKLPLP